MRSITFVNTDDISLMISSSQLSGTTRKLYTPLNPRVCSFFANTREFGAAYQHHDVRRCFRIKALSDIRERFENDSPDQ